MNNLNLARKINALLALARCPGAAPGESRNAYAAAAKLYAQLHGKRAPWFAEAQKAETKASKAKPASKARKAAPKAPKADPSKAPPGKPVWVNGYTRKDGRVVAGYWRAAPKAR